MGLSEVLNGVAGVIAALTPSVQAGVPFTRRAVETPVGIDEIAFMVARAFEVVPIGAVYEGPMVRLPSAAYVRHGCAVRVCYARAAFRSETERADAMARDGAAILGALRNATNWSTFASYITPEQPERAEAIGNGGESIGSILQVQFLAEWEV